MNEPVLLGWSARDERAELALRRRLLDELARHPDEPGRWERLLADHRDPGHPVRAAAVVPAAVVPGASPGTSVSTTAADAAVRTAAVRTAAVRTAAVRTAAVRTAAVHRAPRAIVLMFDGHGAQHVRMGAQLYRREPEFTRWMDHVLDAFGAAGEALRSDWLAEHPSVGIDAAERGQPLLFALGFALARTFDRWGLRPTALVGHSIGELAAAAVAGVIAPADAAGLLAARADAYRDAAPGGLLAVAAPASELDGFLDEQVCVGVVNGPHQTMLSGTEEGLRRAASRLRAAGRTAVRARIPLPFHSPLLAPLAAATEDALKRTALRPPRTDVYSTLTARPLRPEEATDPAFWSQQVSRPVLFGPALDALLDERDVLLVEAGPGRMLTNLARRHPAVVAGRSAVAAMLPQRRGGPGADRGALLEAAAACWLEGHSLDWEAVRSEGPLPPEEEAGSRPDGGRQPGRAALVSPAGPRES